MIATLTEEQQEIRKTGVGASEAPAVVGVDPYRSPLDIYQAKRGLVPPFDGNEFTRWGQRLEAVIADAYAEEHDCKLVQGTTVRHPKHRFLLATPDRHRVENGKIERLVEIKNVGARAGEEWGEVDDDVPERYLIQCQVQMEVMRVPVCDLVALIGGNDLRTFTLYHDVELMHDVIDLVGRFWRDSVEAGIPPDPADMENRSEYLAKRFPVSSGRILPATAAAADLLGTLASARLRRKTAEEEEETAKNALKALIGDADGIDGIATWKNTKATQKTDWEAVAREAGASNDLVTRHTNIRPGIRRFLPKLPRETK